MKQNRNIHYAVNIEMVSSERLDGETMIINFNTGAYFLTKEVGSDIVFLIGKCVDRRCWVEILATYWEIPSIEECEKEIDEFIVSLLERELILEIDSYETTACELPKDINRSNWSKPSLTVFEDMKELLMIDPIHDTSLEGWPNKNPNQ